MFRAMKIALITYTHISFDLLLKTLFIEKFFPVFAHPQ